MPSGALFFLKIRPPITGEISNALDYTCDSDARTFTVRLSTTDAQRKRSYYFDRVFDKDSTQNDIYTNSVEPLLIQFLDGYNVSILALGCSDSGKTYLLNGSKASRQSSGLLSIISQKIYDCIDKKMSNYKYSTAYQVGIQIYEVYAELARDLIDTSNDGLDMEISDSEGPTVRGLAVRWASHYHDLISWITSARLNRVGDNSASGEKSTIFYTFRLKRHELPGNQHVQGGEVISKFTIVELCGAELFLQDPKKLVLKEGLYVTKTITGFWNAVKDLSLPKNSVKTESPSIIQSLLTEEFGGNSITSFLLTINAADDPSDSLNLLNSIDLLREIMNFPIRNDENYLSLQRKTRRQLKLVQESKIEALRQEMMQSGHHGKSKLLPANVDSTRTDEDFDKIQSRFHDLNTKFNSMLVIKANIEAELVSLQSEKLNVQKALIDAQIDNNKIIQESEDRMNNMSNKILALESEIMQTELKMNGISKENFDLKKKLADYTTKSNSSESELKSLEQNFELMNTSYKKLLNRNEEMGLELISLINIKTNLLSEKDKISQEMSRIKEHNKYLESKIQSYTQLLFEKGIEAQKLKDLQESHESFSVKIQRPESLSNDSSEAEKIKMTELERENARMQKILTQSMTFKDQEHGNSIQSYIDKIGKLENDKKSIENQISEYQIKMKRLESDLLDCKSKIQEYSSIESRHMAQIQDLHHKMDINSDKYRKGLETYIQKILKLSEKSNIEKLSLKTLKEHVDDLFRDIIYNYAQREEELKKSKGQFNDVSVSSIKKELMDFISTTQLDMEKERSQLLTRCAIAEERIQVLERELQRH